MLICKKRKSLQFLVLLFLKNTHKCKSSGEKVIGDTEIFYFLIRKGFQDSVRVEGFYKCLILCGR